MKLKNYKLNSFIVIVVLTFMFYSCNFKKQKVTKEPECNVGVTTDKEKQNSNKELTNEEIEERKKLLNNYYEFFYTRNTPLLYRGYAEYGHYLNFEKETLSKEGKKYYYKGTMADGIGEDENKGPREFSAIYEVTCNGIIEKITNDDYYSDHKKSLNSIIENYIVIKGEIAVGNSWEQVVDFKGKEYRAKTEIIEVVDDMFTTETIINGIQGFKKGVYIETRTYKKSFGLIRFSVTAYYENENIPDDDLGISYSLNMSQ